MDEKWNKPWPPWDWQVKGYIKCDGEQILFLDSSAYNHIKAFKSPNSVKLLSRDQVFPVDLTALLFLSHKE